MRNIKFENDHIYHVFNRGVDKRSIFLDSNDSLRFYESLQLFNTLEPIGTQKGISDQIRATLTSKSELVDFIGYCLNPNHFHLLVIQKSANGISEYLKRVGTGYTRYFNNKYKRSGSLFESQFKAVHVEEGDQLEYLLTYVNRNNEVHRYDSRDPVTGVILRGWEEYVCEREGLCTNKAFVYSRVGDARELVEKSDYILPQIRQNKVEKRERDLFINSDD